MAQQHTHDLRLAQPAAPPVTTPQGYTRNQRIGMAVGGVRIAVGAGLLALPGLASRVWVGPGADGPTGRVLARALGARDVMLGWQTLQAARQRKTTATWCRLGAFSDAADAVATTLATRSLTPARRVLMPLIAGAVAAAGYAAAEEVATPDGGPS